MMAGIDAKVMQLLKHQFDVLTQSFSKIGVEAFFRTWCFTGMSRGFDRKSQFSKPCGTYGFEVIGKQKAK